MITKAEAIKLLTACKDLVVRVSATFPGAVPPNGRLKLTEEDLKILQGFDRVQGDPIVAGPGLLGKLEQEAGLTNADVIKLEQLRRLMYNRHHFVSNNKLTQTETKTSL